MKTTTETFVDENGNKKQKIITGPAVNNNDIIETYTTQIEALGLTDDQKVSIYKNILVDQYKLDSEALSYNPNGATELSPAQQKTFDEAIAMWAGTKANNDVAAVTKQMGGSEKIVNVPKEELSNNLKNTRFEFTKLIKGEQESLAISASTYFAKGADGWNVYTVGSQMATPRARYEKGKADVIDLVADLPASFNIDKEALIKQLRLVN
jgi:ketosteroid isomerase-like protein